MAQIERQVGQTTRRGGHLVGPGMGKVARLALFRPIRVIRVILSGRKKMGPSPRALRLC